MLGLFNAEAGVGGFHPVGPGAGKLEQYASD